MSKSKIDLITKEQLKEILTNSSSFEEVCKKIGYKQISNNLKERLIEVCEKSNLDYSVLNISFKQEEKVCTVCKQIKSINDFYSRRNVCKECVRKKERDKYTNKMFTLNEYKKSLKCLKCQEDRYYLLDFHHKNPEEKNYSISSNLNAKIETIMKEIEKCIPLCANCHREFHFLNKKNEISLEQYLEG